MKKSNIIFNLIVLTVLLFTLSASTQTKTPEMSLKTFLDNWFLIIIFGIPLIIVMIFCHLASKDFWKEVEEREKKKTEAFIEYLKKHILEEGDVFLIIVE